MVRENLMNSDHKATNEKYRTGYDSIRWEKPEKFIEGTLHDEEQKDQKRND